MSTLQPHPTHHRLFIGGAADGQHRPVRVGDWYWRVAVFEPDPELLDFSKPVQDKVLDVKHQDYERQLIRADGKEFEVFVLAGMSMSEALARLLQFYTPPKEEEEQQ